LRIDLYTFFPGTLVVRDGSTDLGHTPVSKIERRGSSPGKLKGHVTTTFDLAPGRHALVITYLQDRRQPLTDTVTRVIRSGETERVTVDIGTLGSAIDVR